MIESIDQEYQTSVQGLNDWTTRNEYCTDIVIDASDRIWIAGGKCRKTLHMFDGEIWREIYAPVAVSDFAVDANGHIWVIPDLWDGEPGVSVYDGQQWTTYSSQHLGLTSGRWGLAQIESSPDGRIWVSANAAGQKLEILLYENNIWKMIAGELSGISVHSSMRSDRAGNLWVVSASSDADSGDQLYVFDGHSTKEILYQGGRVGEINAIAFDDQNHLWVLTRCGGIRQFADNAWKTYREKQYSVLDRSRCNSAAGGADMYLDRRGRIWLYGYRDVHIFDGQALTTLTFHNSGITGAYGLAVDDLVVDGLDRVWLLNEQGLNMLPVKDIRTLPETLVDRWNWAMYIDDYLERHAVIPPAEIFLVWLMALLNVGTWRETRISDLASVSDRKIRRLVRSSFVFGNVSLGGSMLYLIYGTNEFIYVEILAYLIYPALYLLIIIGGVVGLVAAFRVIAGFNTAGPDDGDVLRKAAYRGVVLSMAGLASLAFALVNPGYF
jgi:hypothetical protein